MGAPGRPRPQEAGSARRVRPGPADRGDRGGQGRREGAEARGAYSALAGSAGEARGAGWAATARGGRPGRRPQPRRALGPRLPPPAPRWRRGPRGSPAREAGRWGGGRREGSGDKKGQPPGTRRPGLLFLLVLAAGAFHGESVPAVPSPAGGPRARSRPKRWLGPHAQRKGQVQRRGARRDAPPGRRGGSCKLRSPGSGSGSQALLGLACQGLASHCPRRQRGQSSRPSDEEALCTEALRQRQGAGKGGGALGRAARGGEERGRERSPGGRAPAAEPDGGARPRTRLT